jgi:triacylglycerol lipase
MPTEINPVPVLLHGLFGFSHIGPVSYFRGIEAMLRRNGITPLVPSLPPTGSIADRAEALAHALKRHPASSFVLLGHSMGGLDGRFLIANLDPDRRVRVLVSVATPHLGTPVASHLLAGTSLLTALARGLGRRALLDLEPAIRERDAIPDRTGVRYLSYAAVRSPDEVAFLLRRFARLIQEPNDGLVPLSSAQWGEFRETIRSDHFEAVGWSFGLPDRKTARPFDHTNFWLRIVKEAIAAGKTGGWNHEPQTGSRRTG